MSHPIENRLEPPSIRPRRIAFCITELDPGGAEQQFVQLVTAIDRSRFTPEVVCLSGRGALVDTLERAGVPVACLDARGRFDPGVVVRLCRHFRRTQPELVQTFLFHANLAGRIAARLAGVPVVVSGIRVAEHRRRWYLWCDRITDRLVDRHVCVSRSVAEFSATTGGLPASKLIVIPNAVDAERFASSPRADLSEFGIPESSRVVLFIGRLDEQKNPALLLEAFRLIEQDFPDVRLLIVGNGPLAETLWTNAADLKERVVFAGRRDDIPALLKSATCLALPSRWEGMPNVVLEAIASGTPVVAANAEGVAELLQSGSLGLIVPDLRPESWAGALRWALDHPQKMSEMAQLAQHVSNKEFTTSENVAGYSDLYRKLLSGSEFPNRDDVVRSEAMRR